MKERANAILVFLIGLLLIVYWMWPAADQPIGHLHERRIIRIQLQDVRKRSFEVSDSAFIQRFVRHLDASKPVLGLTGRDSRGFFQCWLTAANRKDPIVIDMLCKGKHGNWINQQAISRVHHWIPPWPCSGSGSRRGSGVLSLAGKGELLSRAPTPEGS